MDASTTKLRARQRQQTRAELVRAAFDLFGRFGYEAVSMDSVAVAAGVSRATLFNYFPQKELILREIAGARAEKLKSILEGFVDSRPRPGFKSFVELVVKLSEENARISTGSKKLLLDIIFHQASQGLFLKAREEAIHALATALERIPRRKTDPRLMAEMVFCVYIATMLEWLMREGVPNHWLADTMRTRLAALREGTK